MCAKTSVEQDYILPYFETVCRARLDTYLARHEFVFCKSRWPTTVIYVHDKIFLEMGYWIEDAPRYFLMLGMGLLTNEWRCNTLSGQIGLWSALPIESDVRQLDKWMFSNAAELDDLLIWCCDRVLDVYAKPLWEHQEMLSELVRRSEVKASAKVEIKSRQAKKEQAEKAFKARDYKETVDIYTSLSDAHLSMLEQKRLRLALRWLDASNNLA